MIKRTLSHSNGLHRHTCSNINPTHPSLLNCLKYTSLNYHCHSSATNRRRADTAAASNVNFAHWNHFSNLFTVPSPFLHNEYKNNLLGTNSFTHTTPRHFHSLGYVFAEGSQKSDQNDNDNTSIPALRSNPSVYSKLRRQLYLQFRGPSIPTIKNGAMLKSVLNHPNRVTHSSAVLNTPSQSGSGVASPATGAPPPSTRLLELPQEVLKYNSIPRHTTYVMQSFTDTKLLPILAQPSLNQKPKTQHFSSESAVIRAGTGNVVVSIVKMFSYYITGSAAMFAESLHSIIDTVNQGFLYKGVRQARQMPDKKHQYGYGRSMYIWSMISATAMFWTGGFVTVYHGVHQILTPDTDLLFGWVTPAVLIISGAIDSYVFFPVLIDSLNSKPKGTSWYRHLFNIKDPMIASVLLEDMAACLGVVIAFAGLSASYLTSNPLYDGLASITIGLLLGSTSGMLIAMNKRFLLGQAVDAEIEQGIRELLEQRKSISKISAVQSQWLSANRFIFKAELDFEGEYFANYLGQLCYNQMFKEVTKEKELTVLLNCYTEDVIRMMEEEIDSIEDEIRTKYPEAGYIELEPSSIYPTSLKAMHFTKTLS